MSEIESENERNGSESEEKSGRKTRCHWGVITRRQADSDRLTWARTGPTVVYTGKRCCIIVNAKGKRSEHAGLPSHPEGERAISLYTRFGVVLTKLSKSPAH